MRKKLVHEYKWREHKPGDLIITTDRVVTFKNHPNIDEKSITKSNYEGVIFKIIDAVLNQNSGAWELKMMNMHTLSIEYMPEIEIRYFTKIC